MNSINLHAITKISAEIANIGDTTRALNMVFVSTRYTAVGEFKASLYSDDPKTIKLFQEIEKLVRKYVEE